VVDQVACNQVIPRASLPTVLCCVVTRSCTSKYSSYFFYFSLLVCSGVGNDNSIQAYHTLSA